MLPMTRTAQSRISPSQVQWGVVPWGCRSGVNSHLPKRHQSPKLKQMPGLHSASKGDADALASAYSPMDSPPFQSRSFVDTTHPSSSSYDSSSVGNHRPGHMLQQHTPLEGVTGQIPSGFGVATGTVPMHSRPDSISHISSSSSIGLQDGIVGTSFLPNVSSHENVSRAASSHQPMSTLDTSQPPLVQEVEVVGLDGTTSISGSPSSPPSTTLPSGLTTSDASSAGSAASELQAQRTASDAAVLAAVSHVNRLRGLGPVSSHSTSFHATAPSQPSAGAKSTLDSRGGAFADSYISGDYSEMYRAMNTLHGASPPATPAAAAHTSGNHSTSRSNSFSTIAVPVEATAVAATTAEASTIDSDARAAATPSSERQAPAADAAVADAIARAQSALNKAESSLDEISHLPSARPARPFERVLQPLRSAAIVVGLITALLASHAFGLVGQWLGAAAGAAGIAVWGFRKGSLNRSGALAAAFVGMGTLGCSLRLGATLLAFFFSSSKLTAYKEEHKEVLDESSKKGGQRDWMQVLSNGLVPTLLAIAYGVLAGCVDLPLGASPAVETWRAHAVTALMGGFLGYYACCCGDTWASELGPLSADQPRLITTFRPVRKGTNGAVTMLGLLASILGGTFVGLVFYLAGVASPTLWVLDPMLRDMAIQQWRLIPLGLMAGLFGSVLDSVLGATVQFTGYSSKTQRVTSRAGPDVDRISGMPFLSNNGVNILSSVTTAVLTALMALNMFGC